MSDRFIVQAESTPDELFNVVQYFSDGKWEELSHHVPAETAFERFRSATMSIGASIGTTASVLITDVKTESVCAEWRYGKGIVFPTQDYCIAMAAGRKVST